MVMNSAGCCKIKIYYFFIILFCCCSSELNFNLFLSPFPPWRTHFYMKTFQSLHTSELCPKQSVSCETSSAGGRWQMGWAPAGTVVHVAESERRSLQPAPPSAHHTSNPKCDLPSQFQINTRRKTSRPSFSLGGGRTTQEASLSQLLTPWGSFLILQYRFCHWGQVVG